MIQIKIPPFGSKSAHPSVNLPRLNVPRRFVGIAFPDEVRWALARKYSWLEAAYVRAQYEDQAHKPEPVPILSKKGALEPSTASTLFSTFVSNLQNLEKDKDNCPGRACEWVRIEKEDASRSYWEHANWIDEAHLESDLGDALHKSGDTWFKDSPDISQVRRVQAVLRRKGAFVALIDRGRLFNSLIDRKALLEQVAEHVGAVSDDQLPTE
jgi:hypothetical protein